MAQDFIEDVSLKVNGFEHKGWQGVIVRVAIDALARSFELQMSYEKRSDFPAIELDSLCEICINGHKVITGRIDSIDGQKTATNHSRIITGRSITRDIVDSSVWRKSNQLNDCDPFQIAEKICEPFSIKVINLAGALKKIPIFRWADGARAGAVIQDACRQQGLTVRDNAEGDLVITRPRQQPSRGAFVEGSGAKNSSDGNIEGFRLFRSSQDRYSNYIVKGRSTQADGRVANQKRGEATDDAVKSFRPLIIQAEGDITNAVAKTRALHEAQKRIALSYPLSLTVSGWRHAQDQEPWRIDELASVSIPSEEFTETLLIRSIVFEKRKGTRTRLELVDPDSYTAEPTGGKKAKAKFDASKYITDLGPQRSFIDGATISDTNGIAG